MARPRKFTPSQRTQLKALRADGWSVTGLADRFGVAEATIRRALLSERAYKRWLVEIREYMRSYRQRPAVAKAKRRK